MSDAGVLGELIAGALADLAVREARRPLAELEMVVASMASPRDPMPAFRSPTLSVIAEVKRASPSKGALASIPDPAALATEYARGGASAISVLTERRRFGGDLADLVAVRAAVETPVLRKDFIVTAYQLWEARAAGADLALLIVAGLSDADLSALLGVCRELALTPLVEVHTPDEARRALDAGAELIGVNNRDLKTLQVDIAQFELLAGIIGDAAVKVAESGLATTADVRRVAGAGADVILVGEALVKHGDPAAAIAEFVAEGTAAYSG